MKYNQSISNVVNHFFAFISLIFVSFFTLISFIFISIFSFSLMVGVLIFSVFYKIGNWVKIKVDPEYKYEDKLVSLKEDKI